VLYNGEWAYTNSLLTTSHSATQDILVRPLCSECYLRNLLYPENVSNIRNLRMHYYDSLKTV